MSGSATVDSVGEPPPSGAVTAGPVADAALPAGQAALRASVLDLPERFRPQDASGLRGRWVVRISDHGAYTIEVSGGRCTISIGAHDRPDATVETDAQTWFDITAGRSDGVAAFSAGRLTASGDLNLALRLDTLFRPGRESRRLLRTINTVAHGVALESFVAGRGTPVILLHGLAASKVSFIPTIDGLADHFEVHALDLPGFGKSEKPLPAGRRYHPRWMADVVHAYLRANHLRHAHLVGNSMGGRIAVELALCHPRRVLSVTALGAAVAFDEWQWAGVFLRRLQGHWVGLTPMPVRTSWLETGIADLFADPTRLPPGNLAAAAAEVARDLRSPRHRLAIAACARHIAGERASGRRSFWRRLERLRVPNYWIWGREDRLSACRYAERARRHVRDARIEVWDDVGHVPQFEDPARTNAALLEFLGELEERWRPTGLPLTPR